MSADLPPLNALRAFHAAASCGSMQGAAARLGVTPSAVSHQVRALERWLGAPLFVRAPRRVTLTAAGATLLAETTAAFARITSAAAIVRAEAASPTLRVSALPFLTNTWLIPRLARFRAKHPEIEISVETSNELADLDGGLVDVGLRNSRTKPSGVSARKLFDIRGTPVCAPARAAGVQRLADLAGETLIHVSSRPDAWAHWLAEAGAPALQPRGALSFDAVPDAMEAAAGGHGVALAIDPLIWDAPVAARLAAPLGRSAPTSAAYYAVHRRGVVRPAVRAFVEWLAAEAAATRRAYPANSPR